MLFPYEVPAIVLRNVRYRPRKLKHSRYGYPTALRSLHYCPMRSTLLSYALSAIVLRFLSPSPTLCPLVSYAFYPPLLFTVRYLPTHFPLPSYAFCPTRCLLSSYALSATVLRHTTAATLRRVRYSPMLLYHATSSSGAHYAATHLLRQVRLGTMTWADGTTCKGEWLHDQSWGTP
eukprot:3147120-Rhodomonas_salina.1